MELNLICSDKNSGAHGIPNNKGLHFSRGEYISFIDADDAITPTALEELYTIAKKFDADVVHCERYYQFNDGEHEFIIEGYQTGALVTEPTLITENLAERVKALYEKRFLWNLWTKLIRRDFMMKNNLQWVGVKSCDVVLTSCLVCTAKNYVRVPNIINLYRVVENSMSHKDDNVDKTIRKWLNALSEGFNHIDKFLDERKFFIEHKDVKNLVLETWVRECCGYLIKYYAQIPSYQLDEIIRRELSDVHNKTPLMAFLFSRMNVFNVNLNRQNSMLYQMNAHIQKQNEVIQTLQATINRLQQK